MINSLSDYWEPFPCFSNVFRLDMCSCLYSTYGVQQSLFVCPCSARLSLSSVMLSVSLLTVSRSTSVHTPLFERAAKNNIKVGQSRSRERAMQASLAPTLEFCLTPLCLISTPTTYSTVPEPSLSLIPKHHWNHRLIYVIPLTLVRASPYCPSKYCSAVRRSLQQCVL